MDYKDWIKKVDDLLADRYGGFTHNDLPDYCWMSLHRDGDEPEIAFESFCEEIMDEEPR